MQYGSHYRSSLGGILLLADDIGLTGLWFENEKNFKAAYEEKETAAITAAGKWLDSYFSGQEPDFEPPLHLVGTDFQLEVWEILRTIPYGQTTTYGQIAKQIADRHGLPKMSAQAVGGAVGRNKISIIVPCHRVIGADGSLTGYAGGLEKKVELLRLERVPIRPERFNYA